MRRDQSRDPGAHDRDLHVGHTEPTPRADGPVTRVTANVRRSSTSDVRFRRRFGGAQAVSRAWKSDGVAHAVVLVAVVHQHVDLACLRGELVEPGDPGLELTARVEVPEPLGRAPRPAVPAIVGAAVEAHHGEPVGRHLEHPPQLRHARCVDDDEREPEVAQLVERPVPVVGRQPARCPELDAHRQVLQVLAHLRQRLAVRTLRREPLRILHEHRAELARGRAAARAHVGTASRPRRARCRRDGARTRCAWPPRPRGGRRGCRATARRASWDGR